MFQIIATHLTRPSLYEHNYDKNGEQHLLHLIKMQDR